MWKSTPFDEKVLEGFERSETSNGVPYYINHNSQRTQWDHPYYEQTFDDLGVMNSCRYAAYRTALKVKFLQKQFGFENVTLHTVQSVFGRRGLGREVGATLDCHELYIILTDILATEEQAELVLNWILNLYDPDRKGSVPVSAAKAALTVLSSARLSDKYRYLFQLSTDHTNLLGRKRLATLLSYLVQIPELMNESQPFGGLNVEPAVNSCFSMVWSAAGASEDVFLAWLLREPQTVVWLPTFHRLAAAEEVRHECKCNVCKTFPITGFRYRCLKCFNYDMCQSCFFNGRTVRNHKLKHPTQEYCINTTSKEDTMAFMKTIRNNISRKHCNKKKLRYLPIQGPGQPQQPTARRIEDEDPVREVHYLPGRKPKKITSTPDHERVTADLDIMVQNRDYVDSENKVREKDDMLRIGEHERRELESVIEHLENENRELMGEIQQLYQRRHDSMSASSSDMEEPPREDVRPRPPPTRPYDDIQRPDSARQEVLKAHNQNLELQLQRLRNILSARDDERRHMISRSPLKAVSPNIPRVREPFHNKPSPIRHPRPYQLPPAYNQSAADIKRDFLTPSKAHPVSSTFLHGHHTGPRLSEVGISRVESRLSEHSRIDYDDELCRSFQDQCDLYSPPLQDTSYASYEGALSKTQFSLPSAGQSRYFPDEEAELEELIEKLDMAYPGEMTHSVLGFGGSTSQEELCRAGNEIGEAFTAHVLPDSFRGEYADIPGRRERDYMSDEEVLRESVRSSHITQRQYITQLSG